MPDLWKKLAHDDQEACERFVEIMQEMDHRYRAFKVEQLQSWINPADRGCYTGQTVDGFSLFASHADTDHPRRMQLVLLGSHEPGAASADALMLGWAPAAPLSVELLDTTLDQILELGSKWLHSLDSKQPVKSVTAIRPKLNESSYIQALHDHIYWRAAVERLPAPAHYLNLEAERDLGDAVYLRLALIP